ncbi:MAG TPA: hypothetical protein VME66_15320, partial [Candidatus Acidoferrales bacterium]|nr:hypothetical protein [Candidatus Acidoferrales bacterium]
MRNIEDILNFRDDISPFLVHLTKNNATPASDCLRSILRERRLVAGATLGDAKYGLSAQDFNGLGADDQRALFGAVSMTETPLNDIHCLFDIVGRDINLLPYGLVFTKESMRALGASPVLYLNNDNGDKDDVVRALCSLRLTQPAVARQLLPLISFFGLKLSRPGYAGRVDNIPYDWLWEREWRYPHASGPLVFEHGSVFVGLCPDDEIEGFEAEFAGIPF